MNRTTAIIGLGTSKLTTLKDYFLHEPVENVAYHFIDTADSNTVPDEVSFHLIGERRFHGLGSAGDVRRAESAIKQDQAKLEAILSRYQRTIFLVGLGGGTGSAALPTVIDLALQYEADFHCFASLPFLFEGEMRREIAAQTLDKIGRYGDRITTIDQLHIMSILDGKKYQSTTHLFDVLNRAFVWKTVGYLLN